VLGTGRSRARRRRSAPDYQVRVRLEPCRDEDIVQLLHWIDSPELMALWAGGTFTWPLTAMQLRGYLEASRRPDSRMRIYRAVDADGGAWLGHLDFAPNARNDGGAQIGRVMIGDPQLRGMGIGRQMIGLVLDTAFDGLGLERVDLHVARINSAARRCYREVGFRKARGILVDRVVADGIYPTIRMTIDRDTWHKRRPLILG